MTDRKSKQKEEAAAAAAALLQKMRGSGPLKTEAQEEEEKEEEERRRRRREETQAAAAAQQRSRFLEAKRLAEENARRKYEQHFARNLYKRRQKIADHDGTVTQEKLDEAIASVIQQLNATLGSDIELSQDDIARLLRGLESGEIDASQSVIESVIETLKDGDPDDNDDGGMDDFLASVTDSTKPESEASGAIGGTNEEEEDGMEEKVSLIMIQVDGISREEARDALIQSDGDVVNALLICDYEREKKAAVTDSEKPGSWMEGKSKENEGSESEKVDLLEARMLVLEEEQRQQLILLAKKKLEEEAAAKEEQQRRNEEIEREELARLRREEVSGKPNVAVLTLETKFTSESAVIASAKDVKRDLPEENDNGELADWAEKRPAQETDALLGKGGKRRPRCGRLCIALWVGAGVVVVGGVAAILALHFTGRL